MRDFFYFVDWPIVGRCFTYASINFLLSGFFGSSETIFLSINRILLYARQTKGSKSAKILIFLIENSSQFLSSIVILNNVTLILSTLFVSKMFVEGFHIKLLWVPIWTTVLMTPCTLIFAEVLPKSLGHPFADLLSYKFAWIWIILYFVMLPLSFIFRIFTVLFSILFGFRTQVEKGIAKNEFQSLLDISLKSGALNMGEREFINNILEFREVQAREAMTPLVQLICIEQNQTVYHALDMMKENQLSILPVYSSRIDNPIGRVRAKDLISANPQDTLFSYVQEAFFVPESAYLEKVLVQMQRQSMPLAFVVDEYGGIVGVLRVEDIVAEIVGEVIEEGEIEFKVDDNGDVTANGLCDIDDLFDVLRLDSSSTDANTLSGFLMEKLGKIPSIGDKLYQKPWHFEVHSLQGRRVQEVKISRYQ